MANNPSNDTSAATMAVPSYVPAQYDYWISDAANATGLSPYVVAAQINDESGFQPGVTSPAGAEGFAQFLPSTYADYGGKGSEYVAKNELKPYERFMNTLLNWSNGNVAQALAAYNAGEGNWQAGEGYANTILTAAGKGNNYTTTPHDKNTTDTSGSGGNNNNGNATLTGFNPLNPASWVSTDTWERIGLVVFGALLILVGVFMLAGKQTIQLAKTAV